MKWCNLVYVALLLWSGTCLSKGSEERLWVVEQDFVKLGKREAYEKYKKENIEGISKGKEFSVFAFEESDRAQYLFLVPLPSFTAVGKYTEKGTQYAEKMGQALLPYFSTIHFTIESLHQYCPNCSFPAGIGELLGVYYTAIGISPGDERLFEEHLEKIAAAQKGLKDPTYFRTWKVLYGSDVPKYLVAVFGSSEKEAEKRALSLEIIRGEWKNIVRQQKSGTARYRTDLSN